MTLLVRWMSGYEKNFLNPSMNDACLNQVGDFLILKSDLEPSGESQPPLWRVDGKTLIQKYECTDKVSPGKGTS